MGLMTMIKNQAVLHRHYQNDLSFIMIRINKSIDNQMKNRM
jgi:hypothetical protein